MMIQKSIQMALKSILSNKMRSFLTVLGIIIGIIAVTVLVSLGQGTTSTITASIESLGTNLLTINIRSSRSNPLTLNSLYTDLFSESAISEVAPTVTSNATIKYDTTTTDGSVIATTPSYMGMRNLSLLSGRFIAWPDIDNRTYAVTIGYQIAEDLFGDEDPIGKTISVGGHTFTVVGVMAQKGSSLSGSSDTNVFIPFTLGQRLYAQPHISTFYVASTDATLISNAERYVRTYLDNVFPSTSNSSTSSRRSSGFMGFMSSSSSNTNENYSIFNQSDMLETLNETTRTLSMMLAGIASISLLVGGIGIMNIMLVSVSERTREIGIRKAIGASRSNILVQFLIEALIVSLFGGVIGIILSAIIMSILSSLFSMSLTISMNVAILAISFSLLVGVIFGIYPANHASKLRPIDALRYEG